MLFLFLNKLSRVFEYGSNYLIFCLLNLLIITLVFVILSFNPIFSVLFLMLAFINLFFILMLHGVEFISFLILLIYVGAISILLLFVLMVLDIKLLLYRTKNFFTFIILFLIILFIFEFFIFYKLGNNYLVLYNSPVYVDYLKLLYSDIDIKVLGYFIYNFCQYSIILITLILLTALIVSISLVKTQKSNIEEGDVVSTINKKYNNLR